MLKKIVASLLCLSMVFASGCNSEKSSEKSFIDKLISEVKSERDVDDVFEQAASNGNLELMDELTESHKISQRTLNKALGIAATSSGDEYQEMQYLIEKGADPNCDKALCQYAYNGWPHQLKALLQNDRIKIDQKEGGYSALYMAMENQSGGNEITSYYMTNLLLEHGAKIEPYFFENGDGAYFADYGQLRSSPRCVKLLANKFVEEGGVIPLEKSVVYALQGKSSKCVETVKKGTNELKTADMELILAFVSAYGSVREYEELIKIFQEKEKIEHKSMSLGEIASCGNIEMFKHILKQQKWDIKYSDKKNKEDEFYDAGYLEISECLDYAAGFGEVEMCKYLCENGIKPTIGNDYPPLRNAILSGNMELVKYIYQYITKYYGRISEQKIGFTLLNVAKAECKSISDNDKEVIDFFFSEGYEFSNFNVSFSKTDLLTYMVNKGMKLSDDNLLDIIKNDQYEVLQAAFKKGYKINEEIFTQALSHASAKTIKLVLDNGVKIPEDILKYTTDSSKATVKVLIEAGAKTDLKFSELKSFKGGIVTKGDFNLADYYVNSGREDLAELVK